MRRKARVPVIVFLALFLALGLSGCLGDARELLGSDPSAPDDASAPDTSLAPEPAPSAEALPPRPPTRSVSDDPDLRPLRFPLDRPLDRTHVAEGSFALEDTGLGGGFVTGGFVQEVDLTDLVPADVPVRIDGRIQLDAEHVAVVGPTARADPVTNGTVWYETDQARPAPGVTTFGGIVKRAPDGTVGLVIEAYTPGTEDPTRMAYTITVDLTATPEHVPVGVPVAFTLEGNETIVFKTEADAQTELLVHGPDDRLLDRLYFLDAEVWTMPSGPGGEVVVVPIWGGGDLQILHTTADDGPAQALRALDVARTRSETYELAMNTRTAWDFTLDARPLRMSFTVVGPSGAPWTCAGTLGLAVRAPSGPALERTAECPSPTNVPFLYEERHVWSSHAGDTWLAAGDYAVVVDNTFWTGHEAYHTVETYAR